MHISELGRIQQDAFIGMTVSILYRYGNVFLTEALKETGIGAGQHSCFLMIAEHDGIRQEDLAHMLPVDKAHVARAVMRLLKLGYVEKRMHPTDARAHTLHLSEKGRSMIPKVGAALAAWNRKVLEGFSPEERGRLMELLLRAADAVR